MGRLTLQIVNDEFVVVDLGGDVFEGFVVEVEEEGLALVCGL